LLSGATLASLAFSLMARPRMSAYAPVAHRSNAAVIIAKKRKYLRIRPPTIV
jgi:hypothetical protein